MYCLYSKVDPKLSNMKEYVHFVSNGNNYIIVNDNDINLIKDCIRIPLHMGIKVAHRDDNKWIVPNSSNEGLKLIDDYHNKWVKYLAGDSIG